MVEDLWHTLRSDSEQDSGHSDDYHKQQTVSFHNASTNSSIFSPSGPDETLGKVSGNFDRAKIETVIRNHGVITQEDTKDNTKQSSRIQMKTNAEGASHCSAPRKNVLFLKTHKTGSSTVQNILYRYGDRNDLTFALPVRDVYMGTPQLFQSRFAVKSPTGKYNMLANHARYNGPGECQFSITQFQVVVQSLSHHFCGINIKSCFSIKCSV